MGTIPQELTVEERNLLSVAYKNAVGSRRAAWRIITSIEQKEKTKGNEDNAAFAREYCTKVETELDKICGTILKLLNGNLLAKAANDDGKLTDVKQFYTQNGKTIEHPSYTVNGNQHKTITDDFCKDWVAETQDGTNFLDKGGLGAMEKAIDAGVVLVMSLWDDHYANMLWLDSIYPVDSTDPGAARGTCGTSSGVPADVESQHPDSHVVFSDIKFGPIGSTGSDPSPTPSPTPSPSGCPGGSLDACIDLCPADVFAACVKSCQKRCSGEITV